MQSEFRNVGRHAMIYGIGVVLGKLASFLMLPIYTRYLSPADYGILELLGMTIDVIGMIAGVGLAAGVFKFYAEFSSDREKRQVISTVAIGGLALALVTCAAGIVFAEPLNQLVFRGGGNPQYFRIFFLVYFFQAAGAPALMLLRIQQRSALFVGVNLVKLILTLGLNIYFVVFRHMGLPGVLLTNILVSGSVGLLLSGYTFYQVGVRFSPVMFRRMTRFGTPLVLWSLGSFVLTFSDRYFLNFINDETAVGIYALAYRFSFVLSTLAVMPFDQVWEPRRFEVAKRPDAAVIYRRMFFYLNLSMLAVATAMVVYVQDVLRIMSAPAFHTAYQVVPLILAATVVQQWTAYCNLGLYLRDRTSLYAWSALFGVAAALALNFLLIPRYGIMGAGWATVGAYVVRFGVVYHFSQKQYHIDYPWARVGALGLISLSAWIARALLAPDSIPLSLLVSTLLMLVAAMVAHSHVLNRGEREALHAAVRRALPRRVFRIA